MSAKLIEAMQARAAELDQEAQAIRKDIEDVRIAGDTARALEMAFKFSLADELRKIAKMAQLM